MKYVMFLWVAILTMAAQSSNDVQDGWQSLHDGKTTKGWHSYGRSTAGDAWDVQDGALHLKPAKRNGYQTLGGGDLVTDAAYDNFELKLEWKISKDGNSGIIFYVQDNKAQYPETWMTGIETQVLDIIGNEDSKSFKHDVADLYDLVPCTAHPAKPYGAWNTVRLKSLNGKLEIYLNDALVLTTTLWDPAWQKLVRESKFKDMPGFGSFRKGHIALQDHGAEVWYRNIMIRPL
jgi:hypothetical protein